jgi:hypothetical protein
MKNRLAQPVHPGGHPSLCCSYNYVHRPKNRPLVADFDHDKTPFRALEHIDKKI